MDANQLFWATGIDNTKLDTNVNEAIVIFQKLSNNVKAELEKIERYYEKVQLKANLKFTNPVDPSMVASIREQMSSLGKVIDDQTNRVANMSLTYDKAMSKINSSTSKLGKGGSSASPIKESVDNVKADVARADKELSFLEKRFKYAASSIIAYGSFRWGKQFIDDMIAVKGEFDQLRVAIDAFTGSSEKGAEIFGQLTRLAVKSPFELRDITNSAKQLLAYGTAADDVTNSVKMLSDVSAGSGQSIKDIAYLYGTSLTQGRLYARDLFQFANRGIPIYGELAKVMGISTEKLMKMTKAGKVGFPELQKAIENMTAAGGKYYGLSDKLAETTYGKISNLKDKWSIALNEMGTETDGIVSTGVEGITALIANWEEVAKAIEGAVIAYGSYKAATAVGALVAGVETYAANYREAESLNILTTARQREDLAKKGFVLGSVEYTAAIKAEAAAQLQNAQSSVVAADEQIVSLNALVVSKSAELLESEKIVLAKRAELEASILLGDQKAIEAAQTELNTAVKTKETVSSEANTLAKELNTTITEKDILVQKVELITTVSDTAAKAANTGTTDLLTLAKIKLTAISAKLNAVIAANPWTAAAIAIGLLVYAVWELYDATTDAEKAQKRINDTIGNQNRALEETRQKTKDLIEVVMSETSTMYDKQEAMQQLQLMMPSVFKNMDIEKVKLMGLVDLNKELNKEINRRSEIGVKANIVLAKNELDQLKKRRDMPTNAWDITRQSLEPTEYKNYINGLINIQNEYINKLEKNLYRIEDIKKKSEFSSLPKQQQIQSLSINKKAIESEIRDLEDRKKVAQKNNEFFSEQYKLTEKRKQLSQIESQIGSLTSKDSKKIKDKDYWDDIKNSAKAERDAMDISEVNGKRWNELVEQERNADKKSAAWDSSKKIDSAAEKAKTKAQKEAERQAKLVQEQNRLNNEILQNKEKLADASKQAELDRAQADIDILEDGYAKKQAQIEANYNREIAKVKEKGDELLKVQQKIAYDQWLIANPNWVKEKKSFTMPTTLSPDNQKTVTSLTGTAEMNRTTESKKMYEKLLIDLQNFDQQRIEIDKKYNDQISYLNKKRVDDNKIDLKNLTDENKSSTDKRIQDRNIETDKAIAEAGRLAKEAKAKISIEELQKEINWGDVFSDLDKMSTDSLTKVRDKIKVLISNINGDASKVDIKEVIKAFDSIDEKLSERDSFTAIKTSIDEYSKATKKAAASQALLNKLSKEGKTGTKEYSDAEIELGKNQNDRVKASTKMTKSFEDIKKKTDGLSSSFKSLGDSIGGALGEGFTVASQIIDITMQGIGGVVSLVNISAAAMTTTSKTASSAMKTIEKASVILAIISAAIQLAMVVINLFNGKSKEQRYYEKLKKELEDYLSVLDKTIESQKEFMNTFTGYEAISSFEKVKKSIESQIDAYRKLASAAGAVSGKARNSTHNLAASGSPFDGNRYISYLSQISYSAGININKVEDLYKLTPEQLKDIRDNNAYAWSLINEDIRNYLDDIITAGKALTEATNQANEALLGLSFDSAKDGLDDLLKSADTTMSDIADNFEGYMRNAMLNLVKGNYLTKELQGWYDKFVADTTSGKELTKDEVDSLRQAYIDIYKNAQSQYDALLDAADITLTNSSNSTSGAISSMSQESADILTAQFSAIRINVSDILLTLQSERPLLELAFNDIAEIARNTRDLADIKRLIGDIKDYGVKMK